MADVRSLLRNERETRRITHPQATYSTTGKLICLVCQIQLKSESLWNGHLRSSQHLTRLHKHKEEEAPKPAPTLEVTDRDAVPNKKRKLTPTVDKEEEGARKRTKNGMDSQDATLPMTTPSPLSTELPSRPSSVPPRPPISETTSTTVDEDEWAAFEKDIAAASLPIPTEAIISAPALSAADIEKQAAEETHAERKTRIEAELEGEKEDAARKLEDEFDDMKDFEERVRVLKEKRDTLRASALNTALSKALQVGSGMDTDKNGVGGDEEEDEELSSDEEDNWDGFRLKV